MDKRRALKALRNSSEEGEERYREAHRAIQREGTRQDGWRNSVLLWKKD